MQVAPGSTPLSRPSAQSRTFSRPSASQNCTREPSQKRPCPGGIPAQSRFDPVMQAVTSSQLPPATLMHVTGTEKNGGTTPKTSESTCRWLSQTHQLTFGGNDSRLTRARQLIRRTHAASSGESLGVALLAGATPDRPPQQRSRVRTATATPTRENMTPQGPTGTLLQLAFPPAVARPSAPMRSGVALASTSLPNCMRAPLKVTVTARSGILD